MYILFLLYLLIDCHICTTQACPGIKCILNYGKYITTMNSFNFTPKTINSLFNKSFQELLQTIRFTSTPKVLYYILLYRNNVDMY